jgi:hypothetical protein
MSPLAPSLAPESTESTIHIIWSDPIAYGEVSKLVCDTDFGIYAIYGNHPTLGRDGLLYIGRAMGGSFGWRLPQHAGWLKDATGEIRVRLGRFAGASTPPDSIWNNEIEKAERLLIFAHRPPLNGKIGFGSSESELQFFHVCNWGAIGDILPEVSGLRWTSRGEALQKNIYNTNDKRD